MLVLKLTHASEGGTKALTGLFFSKDLGNNSEPTGRSRKLSPRTA